MFAYLFFFVGGSLVKIVYLSEVEYRRKRLNSLSSTDVPTQTQTDIQETSSSKAVCCYFDAISSQFFNTQFFCS